MGMLASPVAAGRSSNRTLCGLIAVVVVVAAQPAPGQSARPRKPTMADTIRATMYADNTFSL